MVYVKKHFLGLIYRIDWNSHPPKIFFAAMKSPDRKFSEGMAPWKLSRAKK
jgi:hypothetical protein